MKLPAAELRDILTPKANSFAENETFLYFFSIPWFLTYLSMVSSLPNLLIVLTKNPSDQNPPPHSCSFTCGYLANIFLAVILFIVLIIQVTLYLDIDCMRKWI